MTNEEKRRNRKRIHEIVDIVLDTNDLEGRTVQGTGTLPTMFLQFDGHTAFLEVALFENGWAPKVESAAVMFDASEPIDRRDVKALREKCEAALKNKHGVKAARKHYEQVRQKIEEMQEELDCLEGYIEAYENDEPEEPASDES